MSVFAKVLDELSRLCDQAHVKDVPWKYDKVEECIDYGDDYGMSVFYVCEDRIAKRAARLTVTTVNALPELIRLARIGLEAEQEALRSGAELSRAIGTWDEDRQQWVRP